MGYLPGDGTDACTCTTAFTTVLGTCILRYLLPFLRYRACTCHTWHLPAVDTTCADKVYHTMQAVVFAGYWNTCRQATISPPGVQATWGLGTCVTCVIVYQCMPGDLVDSLPLRRVRVASPGTCIRYNRLSCASAACLLRYLPPPHSLPQDFAPAIRLRHLPFPADWVPFV